MKRAEDYLAGFTVAIIIPILLVLFVTTIMIKSCISVVYYAWNKVPLIE